MGGGRSAFRRAGPGAPFLPATCTPLWTSPRWQMSSILAASQESSFSSLTAAGMDWALLCPAKEAHGPVRSDSRDWQVQTMLRELGWDPHLPLSCSPKARGGERPSQTQGTGPIQANAACAAPGYFHPLGSTETNGTTVHISGTWTKERVL